VCVLCVCEAEAKEGVSHDTISAHGNGV